MRSMMRPRQLVPTVPSDGAVPMVGPFPRADFLLLIKDPADIVYVVITESVIGLTTRASPEGHPAEPVVAPSPLMRHVMGKGPPLLGGRTVVPSIGRVKLWSSMIAVSVVLIFPMTRIPGLVRLVVRVKAWVCVVGRGGPR